MLHSPEQEKENSFDKEDLGLLLLLRVKYIVYFERRTLTLVNLLCLDHLYLVGHLPAVDWLVGQQAADLA